MLHSVADYSIYSDEKEMDIMFQTNVLGMIHLVRLHACESSPLTWLRCF